jgi:hypothetical protein
VSDVDDLEPADPDAVPDWDDDYLDRVSGRLMFNYDLEKDYAVLGERFDLYGEMNVHNEKHFFHPALSFAHHDLYEHLFARRVDSLRVAEFERLVEFAHELSDDWVAADEEHYSTDFTFVLIAPEVPDDVESFVSSFEDRTLLRYGYNGHYEINLVAVAPDAETVAASPGAGVEEAFRLWEPIEREEPGWFDLITRRLQL